MIERGYWWASRKVMGAIDAHAATIIEGYEVPPLESHAEIVYVNDDEVVYSMMFQVENVKDILGPLKPVLSPSETDEWGFWRQVESFKPV